MHTAIPVCKITHMGIQDLISRMEIFPVCMRLVAQILVCRWGLVPCDLRMQKGDLRDPRMHTGITCHAIPVCIQGFFMQSPYAYGDLRDPLMHTEIDLYPRVHTGIACLRSPYAYGDLRDPHLHTRIDFDPHMHMGITRSDWLTPW